MKGDPYYCLSALPTLGELGATPPLEPLGLLELIAPCPVARRVAEVLFLQDDLLQREAFGIGELTSVRPAVLTAAQVRMEAALPAHLCGGAACTVAADAMWEAYFRYAAGVARTHACGLLTHWVGFEVGLRNALAVARATRLGLEPDEYAVAVELGEPTESFTVVIKEREATATPLAELITLIRARWRWMTEHEAWFSFSIDELAVYAGKLMLLTQYKRLVNTNHRGGSAHRGAEALEKPEDVSG